MRDDTRKVNRPNTVLINARGERIEVFVVGSDTLGAVYIMHAGQVNRMFRYGGGAICGMPIFTEVVAKEVLLTVGDF